MIGQHCASLTIEDRTANPRERNLPRGTSLRSFDFPSTRPKVTMTSFIDLGVPARLSTELNRRGITEPFPIQAAAIPDAIAGRNVLGRGRTGSGKTVAFSLPMLTK